jgi:hypothetical protein
MVFLSLSRSYTIWYTYAQIGIHLKVVDMDIKQA